MNTAPLRTIWMAVAVVCIACRAMAADSVVSPARLITAEKVIQAIAALPMPYNAQAALAACRKVAPLEFFLGRMPKQGRLYYERQYFRIKDLSSSTDSYCLEFRFEPTTTEKQAERVTAVRFCYFSPYGVLYADLPVHGKTAQAGARDQRAP